MLATVSLLYQTATTLLSSTRMGWARPGSMLIVGWARPGSMLIVGWARPGSTSRWKQEHQSSNKKVARIS